MDEVFLFNPDSGAKARHVVVIGGGVVGVSTANWLLRAGNAVTLVERDEPGMGASFGNAGGIADYACIPIATPGIVRQVPRMLLDPYGPLSIQWSYLPAIAGWLTRFLLSSRQSRVNDIVQHLLALLRLAVPAYRTLLGQAESGRLLHADGGLYIYGSRDLYDASQATRQFYEKHGFAATRLTADEVRDLEPNIAPVYHGGLFIPSSIHIKSPLGFVRALADSFVQGGGTIVKDEVTDIAQRDGDRVSVSMARGDITADAAVLAAGAWSASLLRRVGERLPLSQERGYHITFAGAQHLIGRPVCYLPTGFYMTPMQDALRIAGTVELGSLDAPPTRARIDLLARSARRLFPALPDHDTEWLGFRPSMPDSVPVIGPSGRIRNLYFGFGHGHIGLTLGGITGLLLARMVNGLDLPFPMAGYSADRFRFRAGI